MLVAPFKGGSRLGEIPPKVGSAVELLRVAQRRVSLDELARLVGLSKWHLARQFTLHVGCPPLRFQNELRLQQAAAQLRAGRRPVDVAYDLQFADQAHLGRHFKRRFGAAPRRYARSCEPSTEATAAGG